MSFEDTLNKVKGFLPSAQLILEVAKNLAKVIPGVSETVGAIELGVKIANGVANEIPTAIKVWNDVQAAANGGREVTSDEWAEWRAQIQEAHDSFTAAVDKVINKE